MRDEVYEEGEGVNGADRYRMKEKDTGVSIELGILKDSLSLRPTPLQPLLA